MIHVTSSLSHVKKYVIISEFFLVFSLFLLLLSSFQVSTGEHTAVERFAAGTLLRWRQKKTKAGIVSCSLLHLWVGLL